MPNLPFSLALFVISANAIRVPFEIHFSDNILGTSLTRRTPTPVSNTGNAQYVSNITLGGVTLPVLLDTGSSDLWAAFPSNQPSVTDLGKTVSLNYAVGKVGGSIATTSLSFGGYNVDNQAFLYVTDTSTFTSNINAQGYYGLLGLGPNSGSLVRKKISGDSRGDTMLTHIFESHSLSDNYVSFLLDRKGAPTEAFTGQLTVSEIVPGFENITSMPKIDVDKVNRLLKADQHWQILTDQDNGIVGPDGQPLKVDSIVPGCPDGQLVAVIDSGFTFSQVPRDISDQIYGRVQGAYYDTTEEFWMIPCGQYLNLTFNFGGKSYPVHSLDTVDDNFNRVDSTGQKVCLGAFQPITSAFSLLGHYDMILGMSFLRNAYTLLDFGDWVDVNSKTQANPYIQLASVTNPTTARAEFVKVRLGGVDTTGDSKWALLPADQMQHSPVSEEEKKKKYQEMVLSRWPYILLGCLVFTLGTTGYCIWRCCCRKGRGKGGDGKFAGFFKRGGKKGNTGARGFGGEEMDRSSHHKLQDEDSSYYPTSGQNNVSMYALNRTTSNHSQQSFQRQQPPTASSYASPSRSNLLPSNNPYSNAHAQNWDNASTYSLQGGGGPPSPGAGAVQHPQSVYAMNPHAVGSVASVHMQRQEYGGYGTADGYAGQYSR
ncbi:acid protease [Macrolepiota fuliginosa MF-IS2]|uniref:Acid protease n=1 Tax=Macrolepiota fuliginosa MF-IS2 TaxID=1400762 RepID=A0A9P5XQ32_9AGAR|nr:acid protease [Macrolepiota fuliginosa MF-IS2]